MLLIRTKIIFLQIHYDSECQVVGGYISHYLLEKSRICTQSQEERNYHVFYMICAGAPQDLKEKLSLGRPEDYRVCNNNMRNRKLILFQFNFCKKYFCLN